MSTSQIGRRILKRKLRTGGVDLPDLGRVSYVYAQKPTKKKTKFNLQSLEKCALLIVCRRWHYLKFTKENNMNKYQKILSSLLLALEWATNNQGNGYSPNRVLRLKNLVEKVEQKIFEIANPPQETEDEPTEKEMQEAVKEYKENSQSQFMHDIEVGRYDRLAPVKWDEVETYTDPNAGTSLDEELAQFDFDNRNNNQGDR